jgi:flavin-binding protein dodecin
MESNNMSDVAQTIDVVGSSDKSWEDAAQAAVHEAKKTLNGIHGIEVKNLTATVDDSTGKITQYRAAVKISLGIGALV